VLEEKQGTAFVIRHVYDGVGNRVERHTSLGHDGITTRHSIKYAYDLVDRAVEVAIDQQPPIRIERDAVGQIVGAQLSQTVRREIDYSTDGYLIKQRVKDGSRTLLDVAYEYDRAGNLTERRDSEFGNDAFTYDPVGRITAHIDPYGKLQRYLNDAAGDRLSLDIVRKGPAETVAGSNQAAQGDWSREGTYEGVFYRFDRSGNVVERHDQRGKLALRWDAAQRLIESGTNGTATQYRYDPLGRRIGKVTAAQQTTFVWDGDALAGDVIASRQARGTSGPREWVYFPDTFEPLAMVGGDAGADPVLYYQNDPNGCPIQLINGKGEVRWAARLTALGIVSRGPVDLVESPLRLQGQYADIETGLSYTRHRYYDGHTGAFIAQDPIGLAGGTNVYAYGRNVHGWIDPLGLDCAIIRKSIPDPSNRFGHFSIEIQHGANKLHTEQVIVNKKLGTTIAEVFDEVPVKQVELHVPNPAAAIAYQESVLGKKMGTYDKATNSCVDHVCNTLRAGGVDVPTGAKEQFKYLKGLGFF
jgi:RHS repeat-associated protein